ncbi:MAG: endonuclease/exonuclease/phosphatase family protein [Myxococcales bacterium]
MRQGLALAMIGLMAQVAPARAAVGHLKVLTYNIAGLPDGFSTEHPSANMAAIGKRLASYDLALLQEDFAYGASLRQAVTLQFQSPAFVRGHRFHFGDGLSQFSALPFAPLTREAWLTCHGIMDSYNDCLTPKGFSYTRQTLATGIEVDVYNVHLDAGGSEGDRTAREAQMAQLISAIAQHSKGRALLLAGDTNIRGGHSALLQQLERETGLSDVCSALHCPDPKRIDRIYVRSSEQLTWKPRSLAIDRGFVDAQGAPLSDHLALAAELDWASATAL